MKFFEHATNNTLSVVRVNRPISKISFQIKDVTNGKGDKCGKVGRLQVQKVSASEGKPEGMTGLEPRWPHGIGGRTYGNSRGLMSAGLGI